MAAVRAALPGSEATTAAASAAATAAAGATSVPELVSISASKVTTSSATVATSAVIATAASSTMATATLTADAAMGVVAPSAGPPPKRLRRNIASFRSQQQLRKSIGHLPPVPEAESADAIVIQDDAPAEEEEKLPPKDFSVHQALIQSTVRSRRQITSMLKAFQTDQKVEDPMRKLTSNDSRDLACDLALKNQLSLAASHYSFQWLRRIPAILFSQGYPLPAPHVAATDAVRQSAVELCQEFFPAIAQDQDQATLWLGRIASCLCWHQLEGTASPVVDFSASAEEEAAKRKIAEWDEAYRSLETSLRQGALSTFSIVSEHFAVTVYGDGTGPWQSNQSQQQQQQQQPQSPSAPQQHPPRAPASPLGTASSSTPTPFGDFSGSSGAVRPTKDEPIAVMTRSTDKLRAMLTENHVMFEVARIDTSNAGPTERKGLLETMPQPTKTDAVVPAGEANTAVVEHSSTTVKEEDHTTDLLELRQDGETIATEAKANTLPLALLFEGSWRVHALLDVLRQFFLDCPIRAQASTPAQLPRLLAPTPFVNSSLRVAEVTKTQTVVQEDGNPLHVAELLGIFFPKQVKRLLELFLVLLPRFECQPESGKLSQEGINTFTKFEHRHVESVKAQRVQATSEGRKWEFKWETTLGT